jgi:hypothetical protein
MSNRAVKFAFLAAVLAMLPAAAGCLAVAIGGAAAGTIAYINGELVDTVEAPPEKVVAATEKAFASLHLTLISKNASGLEGKVVGRTSGDKSVKVNIKAQGEKSSRIAIRIDVFGDESQSRVLLQTIEKNL